MSGIDNARPLGEKLDFLLKEFYLLQFEKPHDSGLGSPINFFQFLHSMAPSYYGASSKMELEFYAKCLADRGDIASEGNQIYMEIGRSIMSSFRFTEKGINSYINVNEKGAYSKKCFIAMSFSSEHDNIYKEGILPSLNQFKFEALRVDQDKTLQYRNNESTINDFILASINQSRFCIADYSGNKAGVYFETGYALGKGKPVIYTCSESDFEYMHFDVDRFPVIRYKTEIELRDKLVNRMNELFK